MVRIFLPYMFLSLILFTSCSKDEPEDELIETCIEGWIESADGSSIYYEKCPQRLNDCEKTFRIYINVFDLWTDGPGKLIVRNIENGNVIDEISREVLLYRHREQIQMIHDKRFNFTHEVTIELPTESCRVNGKLLSYTYEVTLPCNGYANLDFDICDP